jgi:hypothetical protein
MTISRRAVLEEGCTHDVIKLFLPCSLGVDTSALKAKALKMVDAERESGAKPQKVTVRCNIIIYVGLPCGGFIVTTLLDCTMICMQIPQHVRNMFPQPPYTDYKPGLTPLFAICRLSVTERVTRKGCEISAGICARRQSRIGWTRCAPLHTSMSNRQKTRARLLHVSFLAATLCTSQNVLCVFCRYVSGSAESSVASCTTRFEKEPSYYWVSGADGPLLVQIFARTEEVGRLVQILARRMKNNPILLGEAGVGKVGHACLGSKVGLKVSQAGATLC